jgi:hypothetical protein
VVIDSDFTGKLLSFNFGNIPIKYGFTGRIGMLFRYLDFTEQYFVPGKDRIKKVNLHHFPDLSDQIGNVWIM